MRARRLILSALLALAAQAQAYVTSAVLEYSCDDQVAFHLNGVTLLARSDYHPFDFACLSTSDGTLPLHLFNMNGDNLLAVENFDTEGGHMGVAYRLTVHHSSGDPVVVWSEPGNTKYLHLRKSQPNPAGWTGVAYDDSAWNEATEGFLSTDAQFVTWPKLPDEAFGALFGSGGWVPYACHSPTGRANGGDHNLYRNHFKFPNQPEKLKGVMAVSTAQKGQRLAVRLVPGRDAAYFPHFQLFAKPGPGFKFAGLSKGGWIDPKNGFGQWEFENSSAKVAYAKLGVAAVVEASGWTQPEKVLGREKEGKAQRQFNIPTSVYNDSARFYPGSPAWFKMEAPAYSGAAGEPVILGVIFHTQMRMGAMDNYKIAETDPVYLNYSVDGSGKGALKESAWISRSTIGDRWFDGYYDASEDRRWTWADIAKLKVSIEGRQRRARDRNWLASITVVVKHYQPALASPYFYVDVEEANCATLRVDMGIRQSASSQASSDPLLVPVNQALCPPTPMPTSTPLPPPAPLVAAMPTPEPKRAESGGMDSGKLIDLGCLENSPEPFKRGGTFIYFCVKQEAELTLKVYRDGQSQPARTLPAGNFRPGKGQVFFNGQDDQGKLLPPGRYLYELHVKSQGGGVQARNSTFTRVKDK